MTPRLPDSPYQPIAEAEIKTEGLISATAFAIAVVPSSLELRISARYFLLHLLSPTPTPAR